MSKSLSNWKYSGSIHGIRQIIHVWLFLISMFLPLHISVCILKARFIEPTWGPSGAEMTRVGPFWPHEILLSGYFCDNLISIIISVSLFSGKVSRGIGMIVKAKHCLNRGALLTVYNSFIYPYITYCNQVWGCTYNSTLKRVFILQ